MSTTLDEIERRVFGVLMEKSLTQPDSYPMSSNAVVGGCNQKSNRDPVLDLDEETVLGVLEGLRRRGLVSLVLPAPGARVNRYRHEGESRFGWGKRQRAVMTELLLRGPQTVGELRSRCSRMFPFEDLEAVSTVLESLSEGDSPVVAELPRRPGQPAIRYAHLLSPDNEDPASCSALSSPGGPTATAASPPKAEVELSRLELEDLRAEVAELRGELGRLSHRVESLESGRAG